MDKQHKLKYIAEKLKLDVPIMKMIENDRKVILYLYGGSVIELVAEEIMEDPAVSPSPTQPLSNRKESRKRKVLDGRD